MLRSTARILRMLVWIGWPLLFSAEGFAADENWIKIGEPGNGEYASYIDTSSVVPFGRGSFIAWFRSSYFKPKRDGIFSSPYTTHLRRSVVLCAEPAVALIEEIKLDADGAIVSSDKWAEAKWRYYGLPSGSIAYQEAKILCGLGALPSALLNTAPEGNWRPITNDSNEKIDIASLRGGDGIYVLRTSKLDEEALRPNGTRYVLTLLNWIVLCKQPSIGVYAMVWLDKSGHAVDSFVAPLESVSFGKTGELKPISATLLSTVCDAATMSKRDGDSKAATDKPASLTAGTGFLVGHEGHILTNSHVVASCRRIAVRFADRSTAVGTKIAEDKRNDLALVRTDRASPVGATFRDTQAPLGEPVLVAGFPLPGVLSSEAIVSTGAVSALSGLGDDVSQLQVSAPVQPGNSGGPLLDRAGLVVGVVVAKLDALTVAKATGDIPQNVNFAIKGDVARLFLNAYGVTYAVSGSGKPIEQTAVASAAKAITVQLLCEP